MYPVEYALPGWYIIPTFSSYDINSVTRQIRSHKHFNKGQFHIMQVRNGSVIVTDDFGISRRMKVDDLYEMTMFNTNQHDTLQERYGIYTGGMKKINRRYDSNINIITGEYSPIEEKQNGSVILDFSKITE